MKAVNITLGITFLIFAYLQWNDPDPLLWISIYLSVSVLLLLRVFGRYDQRFTILLMALLAAYAAYLSPDVIEWASSGSKGDIFGAMNDDKPYIEGSREFLGLAIAEFALASQFLFQSDR